jgi:hypothetical protein
MLDCFGIGNRAAGEYNVRKVDNFVFLIPDP